MTYPGGLDLQALARLNGLDPAVAAFSSRAFDSDGDGRPDLYLVDTDGDGSVDGVVRAVDADSDGLHDTFVQYGEAGEVEAIGRLDPATGALEVISEDPGALDDMLGPLGLAELESPEEALFTSFGDPYIAEAYGTFGDDVADASGEPPAVEDLRVSESEDAGAEDEEAGTEPPEVVPRIVEIEDRSGGDGSSLWAKVDEDADGLADHEAKLDKTSTGTYYGDIDQDGYSEDVATDLDLDGRIDTVDAAGQGSSADTVGAEQVVDPADDHLVDHGPGDEAGAVPDEDGDPDSEDEAGSAAGGDPDDDAGGSTVADDDDGTDSSGSAGSDDTD